MFLVILQLIQVLDVICSTNDGATKKATAYLQNNTESVFIMAYGEWRTITDLKLVVVLVFVDTTTLCFRSYNKNTLWNILIVGTVISNWLCFTDDLCGGGKITSLKQNQE